MHHSAGCKRPRGKSADARESRRLRGHSPECAIEELEVILQRNRQIRRERTRCSSDTSFTVGVNATSTPVASRPQTPTEKEREKKATVQSTGVEDREEKTDEIGIAEEGARRLQSAEKSKEEVVKERTRDLQRAEEPEEVERAEESAQSLQNAEEAEEFEVTGATARDLVFEQTQDDEGIDKVEVEETRAGSLFFKQINNAEEPDGIEEAGIRNPSVEQLLHIKQIIRPDMYTRTLIILKRIREWLSNQSSGIQQKTNKPF